MSVLIRFAPAALTAAQYDESIRKLPGQTAETALKGASYTQQAYDNLPVGGYYFDPKTQKVKQKAGAPGTAAPAQAAAPPAAAGTAPAPPAPVTAPAGSRAAGEDEEADTDVG